MPGKTRAVVDTNWGGEHKEIRIITPAQFIKIIT
jgi:hypothetical protein